MLKAIIPVNILNRYNVDNPTPVVVAEFLFTTIRLITPRLCDRGRAVLRAKRTKRHWSGKFTQQMLR